MAESGARLDRRRLVELEGVIGRGLRTFIEVGGAIREIRDSRLYKEQYKTFEDYCRERWGWSRSYAHRQIEAADTVELLPIGNRPENEAQARELAPLLRADEREALDVYRELREEHGDRVTATMIRRLVRPRLERIRREEASRRAREDTPVPAPLVASGVRIENSDFRALVVEPGSVDLILTDPPYARAQLDLWDDTAAFAARVLRPGGVLVAYAGQRLLPAYLDALGRHLEYRWILAAEHLGGSANVWDRRVQNRWKPLLMFSKGVPVHDWITDLLRVGDRAGKSLHPHAQAEGEAERVVETFTAPGDLVLDPFCGSGTIPAAAARLGRRVVAAEADSRTYLTALRRVGESVGRGARKKPGGED
ncbi:MAG: site-specific DNA-methyltransferase [Rubrobacteraceae bacterium]